MSCEKDIYATPTLQQGCLWGSCLLLLLITVLAISPVVTSAYAEEMSGDDEVSSDEVNTSRGFDNADDAGEVVTLDAGGESTVGISYSPIMYYADLSPTTTTGQSARIDFSATVNVSRSSGYMVYLKSNSPNLVGVNNSSNVIPSATTAKTYTNMDVNTWGYASSVGSAIADTATYKAVGVSGNGDKIAENTSGDIVTNSETINLSFATKINNAKPADTYQNTMILSVVSSPLETAVDFGIGTMQGMTSAVCSNAKDNNGDGQISGQLRDARDGKYYWVAKLADGKCWMTQNLDLDLSTATTLTNANTDLRGSVTSYKPTFTSAATISSSALYDSPTAQWSWSLGNYRITNPTTVNDCGWPRNSAADCPSQFTAYNTPTTANDDANAHYILGNHYQWNAATAGTGGTVTSGQAGSSICPKGWRLPTGGSSGEFQALIDADNIGTDVSKLVSPPYYFVRGGYASQVSANLFTNAGRDGVYWSSTPFSDNRYAYNLFINYNIDTLADWWRQTGSSVRCIAR